MFSAIAIGLVAAAAAGVSQPVGPVLGIDGSVFTLDGRPAFLLGCSYYGGLGIEDALEVESDLDALGRAGINWIRLWATWDGWENDISAVAPSGEIRQPYMDRLKRLCKLAGGRGMVVDVTVTRSDKPAFPQNLEQHLRVMETLARELASFRNVYFDIGNERNVRDARFVPIEDVAALIRAIKVIDPDRICTASHAGGDMSHDDLLEYLEKGEVDFVAPHRPRDRAAIAETEAKTREILGWIDAAGRTMPVHYQEPFRRGYARENPTVDDYLEDLEGARRGGAAGWCLHNGGERSSEDGRPRRSFDMRPQEGRLIEQLDDIEKEVLARLAQATEARQ